MMRKVVVVAVLVLLGWGVRVYGYRKPYSFSARSVLPNVSTEMKSPGFWISRLSAPDKEIMTPGQVLVFNQDIVNSKLRDDIASFPGTYHGKELKASLEKKFKETVSAGYFTQNGRKADKRFFALLEKNLSLENIPDTLSVRFAVVAAISDQRVLPTQAKLTKKPFDLDFDELQNSSLDINTPVAVLWQSMNNFWSYVTSSSSSGWVLTQNLAVCSRDEITRMRADDFVVITEAKADIYTDKEQRQWYGFARMGSRFEVKNYSQDTVEIALPTRDEHARLRVIPGYMRTKDLHRGYLPYTPRTIIQQAFEMLNTPYGWGGMNGEQDCSQFLQEVFATAGVDIPRDSSEQSKTGISLGEFDKNLDREARLSTVIAKAQAGVSLLYMDGHIMLYLGEINKIPYAIHDTSAYRKRIAFSDAPLLINKVTVSDLSLGEGSSKKSLLERLKSIRLIADSPVQ